MTLAQGPVSARALVEGLASGLYSSRALTETFLARIAADTTIHAVCTPEPERALLSADAADARRASGHPLGPLDGLPMTLKDALRVAGSRTTWGLGMYRNHIPRTTSKAAELLQSQGVVILGRTTVPTGSFDWNGRNTLHAECTNPHDPTLSPGGSSAGAAAAVASGLSPLDIGSDVAGSIRVPCHFCGVSGLRTTDGWLPISDIGPENLPTGFAHLTTFGPIARDVADLGIVLDVWAAALPVPERPLAEGPLAFSPSIDGLEIQPKTRDALERWLADRGAVEATPDVDFEALMDVWSTLVGFEMARGMPWYARNFPSRWLYGRFVIASRLGPGKMIDGLRQGLVASRRAYEAALARRAEAQARIDDFLSRHRAWALPVCPGSAPPLALSGKPIDGVAYTRWHGMLNCPTSVLGTPALALPLPVKGPPIGLQLHGPRFSDRALVAAFT
jgi:amidase